MARSRTIIVAGAVAFLWVSGAAAQTTRTFHLTTAATPSATNEIATIIKTLDARNVVGDEASQSITVTGTDGEVALAAWLVGQLDSRDASSGFAEYTVAGSSQDTVRIFHLFNTPDQASMNELATILRTVGDIQRVFTTSQPKTIAIRTTKAKAQAAEWVLKQLDALPGSRSGSAQYAAADGPQDKLRVFYLANTPSQYLLNELVTTLRVIGDVQRIFTYSPLKAIVIYTTEAKAQLAEWVVQQLDVLPGTQPNEKRYGSEGPEGDVVEVAFLKHPGTEATLNQAATTIRSNTGIRAIFTRSSPQGLAFRGSAEQVQSAEKVLEQMDPR